MIEKKDEGSNNGNPFRLMLSCAIVLTATVVLGFVVYYIIKQLGLFLVSILDQVSKITSKMDAVVIVALITGTVSLIGVVISSVIAKRIDYKKAREEYLAQKREESYEAFIEMVYKVLKESKDSGSYSTEQMTEDFFSFSQSLTLWGSKKVAKKWNSFRDGAVNPEYAHNNMLLLESIMNEMRHDMGVKRLKKGDILSFVINDIKEIIQ